MKKYIGLSILALAFGLTSCDDFLDKLPDNRADIDSKDKAVTLLVSAYPDNDYILLTEYSSDNVDDYGARNPYTDRFLDQVYAWQDITESDNEDSESLWGSCYNAISSANQALEGSAWRRRKRSMPAVCLQRRCKKQSKRPRVRRLGR